MKKNILTIIMLCSAILTMAQEITVPVVHYKDGSAKTFLNTSDVSFTYLKDANINLQPNDIRSHISNNKADISIISYGEDMIPLFYVASTANWTLDLNLGPISGKYNVYIENYPAAVVYPSTLAKPVKFKASINSNGTTVAQTSSVIITDAENIERIKVLENVEIQEVKDGNIVLSLQASVGAREISKYMRQMYIGNIILESVGEDGGATEPSQPAMVLDNKNYILKSDIDSMTVDVVALALESSKEEVILKRKVYGTIHKYSNLKNLEGVRFGLNILDDTGRKLFNIPSGNPDCTSKQNGTDLAVTFTLPPMDYVTCKGQLYLIVGGDSVVSDMMNIQPAYSKEYVDASLAKTIREEQVVGTYNVVSMVDLNGLLNHFKGFDEELEVSGLEPTAISGIYTYTHPLYLLYKEGGMVNAPGVPFTIVNKTRGLEIRGLEIAPAAQTIKYVKPDVRTKMLPDFISRDKSLTIFSEALKATGLEYSLVDFFDKTYSCGEDSVWGQIPAVYYGGHDHQGISLRYPEKRYFKFTAFAETDEVYARYDINNLEDLKAYAKYVYDKTYPADAGRYDDDLTHPKNPLNRFIRYHLMDRAGTYNDWAPSGEIYANCWKPDVADAEDYWETMSGEMLRFCRLPNGNLYANRMGKGSYAVHAGTRVLNDSECYHLNPNYLFALNGTFLYLDDILAYTPTVRDEVLNRRLRIDATTLSPDFMNQGARGHFGNEILCMFKNDYVKNFKLSKDTQIGVHNDNMWWSSYLGNAVCIKGNFDFSVKLPTPPAGEYEVRLGYVAKYNGAIMQPYWNDTPLGIPFDQTIGAWDVRIGWEEDCDGSDGHNADEMEEHNKQIDQKMRNNGYMKAMDSYHKSGTTSFRVDSPESLRRIFGTVTIKEGEDCWLRFKKVSTDSDQEFSFDYIELVPVGVIQAGEDRH